MAFNRNIFTSSDISNFINPAVGTPETMDSAPPAGIPAVAEVIPPSAPPAAPDPAPVTPTAPAAGGAAVPTTPAPTTTPAATTAPSQGAAAIPTASADGYLTKLLKYVPLEILGAYLFVESLIAANVNEPAPLQVWLFWTLAISVVVAMIYMRTVLNVVRATQIVMGGLGLAVYIFATGGWFATTSWYQEWYSSLALAAFAALVGIIKLPNLPMTAP